jgi:hypothetical protein
MAQPNKSNRKGRCQKFGAIRFNDTEEVGILLHPVQCNTIIREMKEVSSGEEKMQVRYVCPFGHDIEWSTGLNNRNGLISHVRTAHYHDTEHAFARKQQNRVMKLAYDPELCSFTPTIEIVPDGEISAYLPWDEQQFQPDSDVTRRKLIASMYGVQTESIKSDATLEQVHTRGFAGVVVKTHVPSYLQTDLKKKGIVLPYDDDIGISLDVGVGEAERLAYNARIAQNIKVANTAGLVAGKTRHEHAHIGVNKAKAPTPKKAPKRKRDLNTDQCSEEELKFKKMKSIEKVRVAHSSYLKKNSPVVRMIESLCNCIMAEIPVVRNGKQCLYIGSINKTIASIVQIHLAHLAPELARTISWKAIKMKVVQYRCAQRKRRLDEDDCGEDDEEVW